VSASASPRPRRRAGAEGAGPVARAVAGAGVPAPEHLADLPPAASALRKSWAFMWIAVFASSFAPIVSNGCAGPA